MNEKIKILFVDDELFVLKGLERMLRPLRNEWEMEFVESGTKALERLGQTAFDVVVSDMRMPGMDGAQLLNEIMQRYPKTVRVILSGHADQELVMKCVGSTHQYLSKPCEPEALKSILRRAVALGCQVRDEKVVVLVSRMARIPSVPVLYTRIIEMLQRTETPLVEVGEVIAQDMGMTATILKLVNSAFFGLRHQVFSPEEAVAYLGMETIKALVLSIHVFDQYQPDPAGRFSLDELWHHSLRTATLAKALASSERVAKPVVEEAFVAGILHDIGKLVLAANFAAEYERVLEQVVTLKTSLLDAEQQAFGATHAQVGAYLLNLWGLPLPVVEAIALHHCPGQATDVSLSPLTFVHVADELAQAARAERSEARGLDWEYLTKVGVADHINNWRELATESAPQEGASHECEDTMRR